MPLFPSLEWMQAYAEELAAHDDAATMARSLDGAYRFVIDAGPHVSARHSYEVEIRPGDPPSVQARESAGGRVVIEVAGSYERWRDMIEGRLDLLPAVLLRRIRVSGDWGSLRSRLRDGTPLLDALHHVPTEWPSAR